MQVRLATCLVPLQVSITMPSAPIHRRFIALLDHSVGSHEFADGLSATFVPDFLEPSFCETLFASDIGYLQSRILLF